MPDRAAGEMCMTGQVFEDFLLEVLNGLIEGGTDRFYLISGNRDNCSFCIHWRPPSSRVRGDDWQSGLNLEQGRKSIT